MIRIREEQPQDTEAIREVNIRAFGFDLTLPRYALGMAVGKVMWTILWSGLLCIRCVEIAKPDLPGNRTDFS